MSVDPEKTLPDRIADELIARIVTGEYTAGERLPAERTLAAELGVDRTSLRLALRQLGRLNLIEARRGSGVTVLDYRRRAGLDVLSAVLDIPGLELGSAFLLETLAHWERVLPSLTARALKNKTPAHKAALDAAFEAQLAALEAGADMAQLAAIAVDVQDQIIEALGDITLQLLANTTRRLRCKLTRLHYEVNDVRAQLVQERALVDLAFTGDVTAEDVQRAHADFLKAQHAPLRAHLASMPSRPYRTTRWNPDTKVAPTPEAS